MSKPNLVVIVEGQTESAALRDLLSGHLQNHGLSAIFTLIGSRGEQGGGHKSFETLVKDVSATAKDFPGAHISTCFDYYGLNHSWPGVAAIKAEAIDASLKAVKVEAAILAEVTARVTQDVLWSGRFHPYIQMHEFEALLFSAPEILGRELRPKTAGYDLEVCFKTILAQHQNGCENINDHEATAPSKRIGAAAQYKKGKTGQARTILPAIGLDRIRQACPHFNDWIKTLEGLNPKPSPAEKPENG
jgi:hypothetical protein